MIRRIIHIAVALLLVSIELANCQEGEELWPAMESWVVSGDGELQEVSEPKKSKPVKHWVEVSRDNFSKRVVVLGEAVDDYFSGDPEFIENHSYARLRLTQVIEENGAHALSSDFKLKADLPKTKGRFKIVFDSSPNEFEGLDSDDTNRPGQVESLEDDSGFSAALRYSFQEWEKFNGDIDIGMKARLPLNPFIRFDVNRLFHLGEKWTMSWRGNVFYFHEEGAGADAKLAFGRQVSTNFYVNNSVRARWDNKEGRVQYSDVLTLSQYIDKRRSISYAMGIFYQEKPDKKVDSADFPDSTPEEIRAMREGVSSYYTSITYRKRMHEDWLFGEVTPSMNWYRTRNFDAVTAISFRLEVLFN